MDWSVTARTTEPHVRETIADRELETQLVVDLSPSLDFGTAACEKRDLADRRARRRHPPDPGRRQPHRRRRRTGERTVRLPARGGLAARARAAAPDRGDARRAEGTRGDLAAALEALRRPPRRRGLVVVVSDFLGEPDWERAAARAVRRATTCSPSRWSTRASWSCPTSARSCSPTPSPAASARSPPRRCCAGSSPPTPPRTASGSPRPAPRRRRAPRAAHRPRLDRRRRAVRARPQAGLVGRRAGADR